MQRGREFALRLRRGYFEWSTSEKGSALTLLGGKTSGFGLLLIKTGGLVGFLVEGDRSVDTPTKEIKEWTLTPKSAPLMIAPGQA